MGMNPDIREIIKQKYREELNKQTKDQFGKVNAQQTVLKEIESYMDEIWDES